MNDLQAVAELALVGRGLRADPALQHVPATAQTAKKTTTAKSARRARGVIDGRTSRTVDAADAPVGFRNFPNRSSGAGEALDKNLTLPDSGKAGKHWKPLRDGSQSRPRLKYSTG